VVLGIAFALVVAVGTAGATGLIPDDVQQALGLAAAHTPDAALTPQIDQAIERTSAPTSGGGTVELWTAPTTGGGTCAYLRHLDATGAPADSGPISCEVSLPGGGRMGVASGGGGSASAPAGGSMSMGSGPLPGGGSMQAELDASGAATVFGQVRSSVASIEVVDSTGAVIGHAATDEGWFLLTLPAGATSGGASIVEQSASGATVGTTALPLAPAPPAAGTSGSGA
jgi:hypothetical protein